MCSPISLLHRTVVFIYSRAACKKMGQVRGDPKRLSFLDTDILRGCADMPGVYLPAGRLEAGLWRCGAGCGRGRRRVGPREPLPRQNPKQNISLALPARRYCNPVRSWQDLRGSRGWNHPRLPGPARTERLREPRWRAGAREGRDSALDWRNTDTENLILPEVSVSGAISSLRCTSVGDLSSGP